MLLALLYLGIKNIHLGPTLPGFLSANVANVLVDKFGIAVAPAQTRFGAQGNGLSIYLADPEGNGIELKEDKSENAL